MASLKWLRRFHFEKYGRVLCRCDNSRKDLLVNCNSSVCLPLHFISSNRRCHKNAVAFCWNCGATIKNNQDLSSICKICSTAITQKTDFEVTDYFKLFNLKREFNIDLNDLKV